MNSRDRPQVPVRVDEHHGARAIAPGAVDGPRRPSHQPVPRFFTKRDGMQHTKPALTTKVAAKTRIA
jgi:hypothetical protein